MTLVRTAKEITRDLIAKSGLCRLHVSIRKFRGKNVDHLLHTSLSERFSAIYENQVWLNGRTSGSKSGSGSELTSTENVRRCLGDLLKFLGTRTLLDIGCGDFTWMKELYFPFNYIGIDIVPSVIAANKALHASERRAFSQLDATHDPLPEADTILCREVMFHLSFHDIGRLLENIRRSRCTYLIATNDDELRYNADILSGDFRMLNLFESPLLFPNPVRSIPDDGVLPDRKLSVWRVADLPVSK